MKYLRFPITALFALAVTPTILAQTRLSDTPVAGGEISEFILSPDGSRVLYNGDLNAINVNELFSASTSAAGTQVQINNTPVAGGEVLDVIFTPDSSRVVYRGDLNSPGVLELYTASATAAGSQITVSDSNVVGGNVSLGFTATADSSSVVYSGELDTAATADIYIASTSMTGTQIRITSPSLTGGGVNSFSLTPDSSRVIIHGQLVSPGFDELFISSTTAAATQIKLNNTPAVNGDVFSATVIPDGSRTIFAGDVTTNGVVELFSASSSAAGTQFTVNDPPVAGGRVTEYFITSDSSRVVYAGDLDTDGISELYSASTSVPDTQIKISSAPPAGGGLPSAPTPFLLTPDSSRAVYLGDLTTDDVFELYSASTSAPDTQITLNDTPVTGGDIMRFRVTLNSSRALYSGDLTTDEVVELYSASTSAPATQIRLTNLPADADVGDFAVTPDGRFVVFVVSDPLGDTLHYVDTLGLSPSVSLTSPVAHFAEIYEFAITSDSRRVVLHADLDEDDIFYLYSVDLPATPPTLKINGKKTITTSKKRLTIRGTATSTAGIQKVEFKVPGSKFKGAKGTTVWQAVIRPVKKRTPVKVRAIANDGKISPVSKVTIKLK